VESDEHRADVALCGKLRPSGIIVPKVESEEDLAALGSLFADCALLPLIESAKGWQSIAAIAQVPSVVRLVFGSLDFQADLDLQAGPEEAELLPVRLSIVAASRAADLAAPIDGVTLATTDLEAVGKAAQRARRLGFGGKLCIHPRQVESVQHAFLPTAAELAWATRVVQAAQSAGGAAVQVDGQMVDRPVVLLAERIMARAG
jgi:citrate lyase subunit beta/citryl-CoA lyase